MRSTLHNFCQLGLAHLPKVQIRKKSAIHSPQFLSTRPGTCPRFRPEKKKSAIHSPQFLSARPCTCPRFRPEKKKCDPLSTISVSSAVQHLPEVQTRKKKVRSTLHNFCQLGLAPARGSDPKKKGAIHSPQFLSARPCTCPRFRPKQKKSAIHSPQFLSARPGTCPRFRPEKKKGAIHSPQFLSTRPSTCPRFRPEKKEKCDPLSTISVSSAAPARGSDPKK